VAVAGVVVIRGVCRWLVHGEVKGMEARCKNCKHWEKVVADPDPEFQTEPELLATRRGYGLCLKIADGTQLLHKEEKADSVLDATTAYTLDGSGYHSQILTGPEFGCVHWEPKP
jgi:hypothetical protein